MRVHFLGLTFLLKFFLGNFVCLPFSYQFCGTLHGNSDRKIWLCFPSLAFRFVFRQNSLRRLFTAAVANLQCRQIILGRYSNSFHGYALSPPRSLCKMFRWFTKTIFFRFPTRKPIFLYDLILFLSKNTLTFGNPNFSVLRQIFFVPRCSFSVPNSYSQFPLSGSKTRCLSLALSAFKLFIFILSVSVFICLVCRFPFSVCLRSVIAFLGRVVENSKLCLEELLFASKMDTDFTGNLGFILET